MTKPTNKGQGPYYRILTQERQNEATIMLYDYIGEYYDVNDDGFLVPGGVRDIEFVTELERLAEQYPVIHLRINSPGGEVYHGAAIVNAIRTCKAEVHTWNDGLAASMAALIWAAGKERHMAKNAMLMFHSGLWCCIGNPKDMRDCADTLDKMNEAMIAGMADSTGIPEEELMQRYFADCADHWLTFKDAEAAGLINAMSEYASPADPSADNTALAAMKYKDLLAYFEKTQHPDSAGFTERVRAAFNNAIAAVTGGKFHSQPSSPAAADVPAKDGKTDIEMNLEEFKNSLTAGTLKLEDVQAHLATIKPAEPAAAVPATADEPAEDQAIAALKEQVNQLTATIEAWGKTPGAGKSTPGMPDADPATADGAMTAQARYEKTNKDLAEAAARNETAKFVIAQ